LLFERAASQCPLRIYRTARQAIDALVERCQEVSVHPGWSTFTAEPRRLDDLRGKAYDAMHLIATEWRLLGGVMDDDMLRHFLARSMAANTMLARPTADNESIHVEHTRTLERPWASSWMRNSSGKDLRQHPDQRYAGWLTSIYKEVLFARRPRVDRVTARLRCPEFGVRTFDYERIILPWRRVDGEPMATLVSVVLDVKTA
jgi:hypothetical protein